MVPALSRSARADDAAEARAHYERGVTAYDLGRFTEAAHEYELAYELRHDPAHLFNIGQAYRFAGEHQKAILALKAYLRRLPDAANRREVEARISEMQRLIDQQAQSQQSPPAGILPPGEKSPAAAVTVNPAPAPAASPEAAATTSVDAIAQVPDLRAGRTEKIAGLTIASLGVAGIAVGIGLGVKAKQDSDEASAIDQQHGIFDSGKDSQGRALGTAGPVLIGVGAAALVAGAVVAIVGVKRARVNHASH
jgi:tetratricopeptide (TPR) repeat protein